MSNTSRTKPLLIILIVILSLLAICGLIIYSIGFRYIRTDYTKFCGWVENGIPTSGSVRYSDGIKGKLTANKDKTEFTITYSTGDIYKGTLSGIARNGNGKITYSMDKELIILRMETDLKVNLKMTTVMDKESTNLQTEVNMREK